MLTRTIIATALATTLAACSLFGGEEAPPAAMAIGIPAPPPLPALAGVYGGSYTCVDGEHGFYLNIDTATVKPGGGYDASGVLGLFPTLAGKEGPAGLAAGSFRVSGTIGADGKVAMTAGDWLKKPAGYGAANLEGVIAPNPSGGYTLTGKPAVPGNPAACSNLIATQFLP